MHCKIETSRVFVIAALPDVTARCHSSCHVQEDGTARTVKELLQEHLQVRLRDLTIFPSVFFPCWNTIILLLTGILFGREMRILRSKFLRSDNRYAAAVHQMFR